MQVADKPDELEKKFEEVHHNLGSPMDSLFLGDLVKDAAINPSTWSRIIIEKCPFRCTYNNLDLFVRLIKDIQGSPDEKAVRSYMEFARCHDAYGVALHALWEAGLALLKDHQENPQYGWGTPARFNGEDDEVKFDFLSESIIDALWPEEKSRIHFFCGQLAKGWRPWHPEPYGSEKTMLSHLMYIKNQLYPDLLECAKRFAYEANRISGEAGHHSDDESRAHPTVIFGHASSTPFACKDAEATEEALCEYAKHKTMPKLFIDAWDKELEANILDGSRSCIEEVRAALSSKISALTKSRRWVKAVQSAYEETRKYAKSLPDLALALYRDYCSHPELYADDLSCHEVRHYTIEDRYPIITALPLRLRRRLLWGFEHCSAVEGSTMLTNFEKEILQTPKYLSLADAAHELAPFYID